MNSDSLQDKLAVQAFYNPNLLRIIRELVVGQVLSLALSRVLAFFLASASNDYLLLHGVNRQRRRPTQSAT